MPARRRIAVGARLADGLLELLDDMGGRRQVGIAHAEVDDVGAGIARRRLGAIDLLEDVGRQAPDAVKFFHRPRLLGLRGRCRASRLGATPFITACRRSPAGLAAASAARLRAATKSFSSFLCLGVGEHRRRRVGAACRGPRDRLEASPGVAACRRAGHRARSACDRRPCCRPNSRARSAGAGDERRRKGTLRRGPL